MASEQDEALRCLGYAVGVIAGLVVLSSVTVMGLEDWEFGRALYFTILTLTTVGYADQGLSVSSR